MEWRRKRNRLTPESYSGPYAYFLTIATQGRANWFVNDETVEWCEESLLKALDAEALEGLAYVFMPDHLHLLALGGPDSNLMRFVKSFKQQTGFEFKKRIGAQLWQKSYYDHIVRREEDLDQIVDYIAENPLQAGLVDSWEDYPYFGGSMLTSGHRGDLKVAATVPEWLHD